MHSKLVQYACAGRHARLCRTMPMLSLSSDKGMWSYTLRVYAAHKSADLHQFLILCTLPMSKPLPLPLHTICMYNLEIWILLSHQETCSSSEYEESVCAILTVLHHVTGGCPDWHASISFLPLWGLAGPVRHCGTLLLRRNHLPLRVTQRVLPVKSHHSQCFPDTQLCVRRGYLHLRGDGHPGPPQVAGGGLIQILCGSSYDCSTLILHLLTLIQCW